MKPEKQANGSPAPSRFKKIGSIVLDALVIVVFLISALLVVANLTADKKNGELPNVFGYVINSVQSDSMSGTFEKGSLVVSKIPAEDAEIKIGDVVSFHQKVGNVTIVNTHRVVDIQNNLYQTQGDNRAVCPTPDEEWKTRREILAVYCFEIPLVGHFIDFVKEPLGFVLILVLPMLAFIAWQVYKLIALYLTAKKQEMLEEAKASVSDEEKDAIIREYLARQQAEQEKSAPTDNSDSDNGAAPGGEA